MGSSGDQTKTVTAITEHICPNIINKDNWVGGDYYPDTFSVQQRETDIVVTRTDSASGWDMNLRFQCCGKISNVKHSKFSCSSLIRVVLTYSFHFNLEIRCHLLSLAGRKWMCWGRKTGRPWTAWRLGCVA